MRIFLLLLCTVVSLSAQSVSPIVAASKAGDASATKKNVLAYMRLVRTEARSADDSDAALALYHTGNALRPFDEINSEILLTEAFDRAMKVGPLSATAVTVASTRNDRFAAAYQDTLAEKSQLPLLIISNLASLNLKKAKDLFASLPDNLTGYKIVTYGDISVRYAANKSFTDVIVELCSSMYKSRPEAATEFFESGMRNYNDPSFTSALKYLNLLNSTGDPNEDAAMQSVHEKAIRLMETDNYIAAHLAYSGFLLQARSAIVGNELPGIAKLFENIDTAKLQREEARLLADAANNYWLAAPRT